MEYNNGHKGDNMNALKSLLALAAVTGAVPASAQLAYQPQLRQSGTVFSADSCEIDPVRGKVNLQNVQARNGIPAGQYRFDCNGTPVATNITKTIPYKHFNYISFDYKRGGLDYEATVSTRPSPIPYRPVSSWGGASSQRPAEDPNIAMCRQVLSNASGNGTIIVGAGRGNCVMEGGRISYQPF